MTTNCLKFYPCSKHYYLLHPWFFITATGRNFKMAWQRITRGWCDRDTWSLDDYLLEILPEMIEYLSKTSHGYPNNFEGMEQWRAFLELEIIERLKNAKEEQRVVTNEYQKAFDAIPTRVEGNRIIYSNDEREIMKKWAARQQEIYDWRKEELKKGLAAMSDVFFDLWN